jgi:hypothetical protein
VGPTSPRLPSPSTSSVFLIFVCPACRHHAVPFRDGRRRIGAVGLSMRAAMQAPGGSGFLGKRKERDHGELDHGYYPSPSLTSSSEQAARTVAPPPPPFFSKPVPRAGKPDRPAVARLGASAKPALPPPPPAAKGTKLLAGYLAHEFLTYGTLLGEQRREAPPIPKEKKEPAAPASSCSAAAPDPSKRYAEVSRLLIAGGARIPGIFNPSQLGGWLGIKE